MRLPRLLSLFAISLLTFAPLQSADLASIVEQAKQNSSTIQQITLGKQNSDLSVALSEVPEQLGIEVSGDVSYIDSSLVGALSGKDTLTVSPSVVISLPNDGDTKITIGATSISRALDSDGYWRANPSMTVSHTLRFGDTGTILEDLQLARQKLEIEQTYRQRIYDFESSVYTKITEILNLEMTLLHNEKDILVQRTKIDNALKLKTSAPGSTTYRAMELELARLEQAKSGTLQKLSMAKTQFSQMTGLAWSGVESIRDAQLSFNFLPTGDTSVVLASLDLEIAKEQLALKNRATVSLGNTTSVPSLVFSGSTGLSYAKTATESLSYSVSGGAQYAAKQFSTGASVSLGISDSGTVSPTVTLSGSWKNDQSSESDLLTIRSLENAVTIAGIDYQESMLAYQTKANQLESDILSHSLEQARFEETAAYREQVLQQAVTALEKGLVTQTEVDQAKLDVELSSYERKIYALDALILENRAKALQL